MPSTARISRRRFLRGAALALGAPCVVASSALAAPAPSDRIVMGFIGLGKQAQGHLGAMIGRSEVDVVGISEVWHARLAAAVRRANERAGKDACKPYPDFRHLLDRRDVNAVLIATPDHWHALHTIRAAEAGKDIYCEKPLSLTIREARAMVDAVRRYARVFQTGSQQRSSQNFRFACEMVRSGRIGKLHTIHVNVGGPSQDCDLPAQPTPEGLDWDMWLGPAPWRPYHEIICPPDTGGGWPQWRRYRDYSGGGMTDFGAHHFDIAQWGNGTDHTGPVEVLPPEASPAKRLTYKYANGVTMYHGGGEGSIHFIGTDGEVLVGRGQLSTRPAELMFTPTRPDEVHLYDSRSHHADWLESIRTRQRPICDIEIGCRTITVCLLGNLAYALKRPLKWDPDTEELLGDPEAARWLDRPKRAPWAL
jgi:predicted dehydrogenase